MKEIREKIVRTKNTTVMVLFAAVSMTLLFHWVIGDQVKASEPDRTVSLGTAQIASPSLPQEGKAWSGDYVFYGNYEGKPIKWRVLDTAGDTGNSSMPGGILLQSDLILKTMPFKDSIDNNVQPPVGYFPDNQWSVSDIRSWLQGQDGFLSDENFSEREKKRILRTTQEAGQLSIAGLKSTTLNRDTMFLLDVSDLANSGYGYSYETACGDLEGSWWLRSAYGKSSSGAGCVLPGGQVFRDFVFEENGVVPAFNLDPTGILFMTAAGTAKNAEVEPVETAEINEWKLTLSEGETLEAGEVERDSDEITVPYTYSGDSASQISVMITDGDPKDNDTIVNFYGKVSEDTFEEEGAVTFTLPEEFDEESDNIYLLAEQVNGGNQTDYASEPIEIELPPAHEHQWEWRFDEDGHWEVCVAPGCDLDEEDAMEDYEEHDFGENEGVVIKEATEEEDGIEEILCDICENLIRVPFSFEGPDEPEEPEEPEGPEEPHEHEYEAVILKSATCTETGIRRYTCEDEDCAHSYDEVIPALSATLSHTFGQWMQEAAPTTAQEGLSRRTCTVCGVSETQKIPKLAPAHEHSYEENAWMMNETYHWIQCECGEVEDMESHEWNKGKVLNKTTKKVEGEIQYRCRVCGKTVNRTLAKVGTKFTSGWYNYKVTIDKNGRPTATLLGFAKGKSKKVVNVPATITLNGATYSVTKIADKAFASNLKIRKVVISNSVEKIGNYSFFFAKNVESITLGTGVKELGEHAFCHTYKLKSVVVKSKKLTEAVTGLLHGVKKNVSIKVPAKKIKAYQRDVFYTHPLCVKAVK